MQENQPLTAAKQPFCRFQERATHFKVRSAQNEGSALDLFDLARAAFLGVLQGLTEFLPVSSTARAARR